MHSHRNTNVTTYGYDALGRKTSTSNLAIQFNPLVSQTYTADGRVGSIAIARNNTAPDTTSYAYDGFDRLSSTTYPNGGSGVTSEGLTYDGDGNVKTRTTRKGDVITLTYDTLNRLSTKAAPSEPTVTYAYDLTGRLTAANDNSAAVTSPSGSATGFTQSATYDALNRPLGFSWTPTAAQTTPSASASVTFTHSYDANNQRVGQAVNDNSWMQYPGAASSIAYTTNALNQYATLTGASPAYDANGNLTGDGVFTYAYDAESRLTSIKQGAATVATYAYDAQGRRKSKTVGATTTAYVTDPGNREVLEYDGVSGAAKVWNTFGSGPDEALNQINIAAGTRTTLIPDIQGSIIGALSSGGTLTKTAYQAFGESTTANANGYFYTGRRLDPETAGSTAQPSGLYYYRARTYSPGWGRFLQADPTGYSAGLNLYAYVANDPLNLVDPFGLAPYTAAQLAVIQPIFGNTINYSKVDIKTGASFNPFSSNFSPTAATLFLFNQASAVTLGNNIYLNPADPSSSTISNVAHETTHIYQYTNEPGANPASIFVQDALMGGQGPAYDVTKVTPTTQFNSLGYEQQATVVEDFVKASQAQDVSTASKFGQVIESANPGLLNGGFMITGGGSSSKPGK